MGNVVHAADAPTPAPVCGGLSLGAGYPTFRAPRYEAPKTPPATAARCEQLIFPARHFAGPKMHGPPPQAGARAVCCVGARSAGVLRSTAAAEDPGNLRALGIFLVGLGIHTISIAGNINKATVQLCITCDCVFGRR